MGEPAAFAVGLATVNSIGGGSLRSTAASRRRQRPPLYTSHTSYPAPSYDSAIFPQASYPSAAIDTNDLASLQLEKPTTTKKRQPPPSFFRVLAVNASEWPYMLVGVATSLVMGAAMPVYAILFGEVLGILADPVSEARAKSSVFAALFVAVGVAVGAAMFLQIAAFTVAGERLTLRLRKRAFAAMLRVGYL